ncbi:ring-cleaving dioxygenase [soil metagenome]
MRLEGIHHITAVTGDAPTNVDFYVRVLGLRMVKKTVNQDDPGVYHLFYADERGSAGSDLTFFEYPGARCGRPGAGMVHRIAWRVGSEEALAFWAERLAAEGVATERDKHGLCFADPEGLDLELLVSEHPDQPLVAVAPDIPAELALQGFAGVRAYASNPGASAPLLEDALGFHPDGEAAWERRGSERGSFYVYDTPPPERGTPGAGTVHHVAWASPMDGLESCRERSLAAGAQATPVIDRFYFRSVYFREPSGVLFELATLGPGFAVDEPAEHLGEGLALPPFLEPRRAEIERALTPLPESARAGGVR